MKIFGNTQKIRGCYAETTFGGAKGTAAYMSINGKSIGGNSSRGAAEPYLISSISFTQKEKFSVVECFGERNFVYAFGHDPTGSVMDVTITTFLVNKDGHNIGDGMQYLTGEYASGRLSKNQKRGSCVLTIGSKLKIEGFIVGMSTSTVDQLHNIQSFTYSIVITNVQGGGGGGSRNPLSGGNIGPAQIRGA